LSASLDELQHDDGVATIRTAHTVMHHLEGGARAWRSVDIWRSPPWLIQAVTAPLAASTR